jgi:cytochrome c oxidase assembly factor CtaG
VISVAAAFDGLHWGEFLPPVLISAVYLLLFSKRARTLAREGRPVESWRVASFVSGALLLAFVQLPPFDTLGDQVLIAHMIQHIIIGDIASLLVVFGLTGPVLQPLLHIRFTRPLRTLANPIVALLLWTLDLYIWHLPLLYQLAIRHDLVHALEHACFFWFGALLWLALIGPLPKPRWFENWGKLVYVVGVRLIGGILGNVLIWTQTVVYPVYKPSDAARGLNPLSDQNLAGAVMMVEQMFLTILLLGWLFYRFALQDEQRQALLDLATQRGVELSDDRAARAAAAGASERLRERLLSSGAENEESGGEIPGTGNGIREPAADPRGTGNGIREPAADSPGTGNGIREPAADPPGTSNGIREPATDPTRTTNGIREHRGEPSEATVAERPDAGAETPTR